jgi:hypothetical protein
MWCSRLSKGKSASSQRTFPVDIPITTRGSSYVVTWRPPLLLLLII